MTILRIGLALISICILLCLSGLVDCRVPFQREVGENEQSDHLLLPSEKQEFNEIARETQTFSLPLEKTNLRRNDEIFKGERSRGFRFGRPSGCHHGKFNHRGQRKSEHMLVPVEILDLQADSRDFHPRMDRPLPEKGDFERGFSNGEWRHPQEGKRGRKDEHMPSPARGGWLEFLLRPFLRHDDPAEFHPREDEFRPLPLEPESGHGFPRMDEFHPIEDEFRPLPREPESGHGFPRMDEFHSIEDEFRPLPREPKSGHGFFRMDEFHPRVGEFRPLPREPESGHGFPRMDNFHPREGEFRSLPRAPESGHGFPRMNEFHPIEDEFRPLPREPEFGHGFSRMDEFHPRVGEFRPEFGHGFPGEDEFHPGVDEFRPEFGGGFPGDDEFHPGVDEFRPEFGHGISNVEDGRQHGDETWDSKHWKKQEESLPHALPVKRESEEFNLRAEELMPLPHEGEFEHGFPGREGTEPRHGHGKGHGEEEKENEDMPFPTEIVTNTFPVQIESIEFHSSADKFPPEEILRTDLQA